MTTTHDVKIKVPIAPFDTHRQGRLSPELSQADIQARLGDIKADPPSADGKATVSWDFVANGYSCSIWDYKGRRWSYYGPRHVFELLFPGNVTE